MRQLTARINAFLASTGDARQRDFAYAPGRVNLIGEHTDYNDGFVLPCAINAGTLIAGSPRADGRVTSIALDLDQSETFFSLDQEIERDGQYEWANYIRGVFFILKRQGHELRGMDLVIAGDVPQGAGLSSSASLQVALTTLVSHVNGLGLSPLQVARVSQAAENDFVGCKCGIMDQLASAAGQRDHATLIDCRTLATESVTMPAGYSLLIVNSNVKRGLVDSAYNERRNECESAAEALGVSHLRDATAADLTLLATHTTDKVFRRARHVILENQRVLESIACLRQGDIEALGRLMADSHRSLRFDFEVTVPAVDGLVDIIASRLDGRGGVRMTGGGFGGCVVVLAPTALVADIRQVVGEQYPAMFGLIPEFYETQAAAGARMLPQF